MSIPPSVLAQYQAVNSRADATANTPFQTYDNEFVAPVNGQQTAGINATNAAANEADPYYDAGTSTLGTAQANTTGVNNLATGLAAASGQQVNASDLNSDSINKYLSPYLGDVLGTTDALANQNNDIAQSGELGNAISSGAFGGDRTGIAAANLNQQNQLAENATNANILNTGYNNALSTAQQQQGVGLAAGQANRAALGTAASTLAGVGQTAYGESANTASELGALGTGKENADLTGAQAQIGAGTVEQQTQQAQDTAEYNQFLQQQSYPFQVDQFLANIAEGTGALSGSTTTTTQPGGFFSDRRLKHDIKKIGKTYDGQSIYSYKMHGDNRTHIGLMAQEVEKKRPEAVTTARSGLGAGYKMVDYGPATERAANRGHFNDGGVVPMRKAAGGASIVSPSDYDAILRAQNGMYAPMAGGLGVRGDGGGSVPRGGSSRVPEPSGAVSHLVTAGELRSDRTTPLQNTNAMVGLGKSAGDLYASYKKSHPDKPSGVAKQPDPTPAPAAAATPGDSDQGPPAPENKRGGRIGKADGGGFDDAIDGILASQEQMYGPQQKSGRNIPSGGGGGGTHTLAVANGTPPPAPSGSSQVQQTLGLANDANKAYKVYSKHSTSAAKTPGANQANAESEGPPSDLSASNQAAMQANAESEGVSAAPDAAPAIDAAGDTAVGDAAAGAGTDAAVSGAADAAIAGGADAAVTDGAADAAVALAAEYAAAEAAPVLLAAKSGGRIRKKYDAGGSPYGDADGTLDIPDQQGADKLQSAGPLVKQPTGLQTLIKMGDPNSAGTIAGDAFSNTAAKRGGLIAGHRVGKDDGGSLDDTTDDSEPIAPMGVATGKINRDPDLKKRDMLYARDAGSMMPHTEKDPSAIIDRWSGAKHPNDWTTTEPGDNSGDIPELAGNTGSLADYGYTPPGTGLATPPARTAPAPARRPAAASSPPSGGSGGLSAAPPPAAPTSDPVRYTGGVDTTVKPDATPDLKAPHVDVDTPSFWDKIKGGIRDSGLTKPENLIPLITALGAMGTAPTRSLGVALSNGLLAGGQSYLGTRQAMADTAQTKASTGLTGAETQGVQNRNIAELQQQYALRGMALFPDANGTIVASNGQRYSAKPKAAALSSDTTAQTTQSPRYSYLGSNGVQAAKGEGVRTSMADPSLVQTSNKQIDDDRAAGSQAQEILPSVQQWEANMAKNKGVLDNGALSDLRSKAASIWNTAVKQANLPGLSVEGLDSAQIAAKMSSAEALKFEQASGQRSFGAARVFLGSTPNTEMQREAALPLIAQMHVENQQKIDLKNYHDEFDQENQRNGGAGPVPRNYLASDARQAFDKDYPATSYEGDREKLTGILKGSTFDKLSSDLQTAGPEKRAKLIAAIDQKYGANFHRYFTGTQ